METTKDKQVIERFRVYKDDIVRVALIGIYTSRRAMGDDEADAEIYALRCYVDKDHPSLTHKKPQ